MDCCIIAISNGGLAIANHVVRRLNGDLVFMPGEIIKHPSDPQKAIGVVGLDYVVSYESERDIPQDFIYRRTRAIQSDLLSRYPDVPRPMSSGFQDRTIIFVDDCVQNSDEILGSLRIVRQQEPKEIVVASPVISNGAAEGIKREADSDVFLHVVSEKSLKGCYLDFDLISDEEASELINISREETVEDRLCQHEVRAC